MLGLSRGREEEPWEKAPLENEFSQSIPYTLRIKLKKTNSPMNPHNHRQKR